MTLNRHPQLLPWPCSNSNYQVIVQRSWSCTSTQHYGNHLIQVMLKLTSIEGQNPFNSYDCLDYLNTTIMNQIWYLEIWESQLWIQIISPINNGSLLPISIPTQHWYTLRIVFLSAHVDRVNYPGGHRQKFIISIVIVLVFFLSMGIVPHNMLSSKVVI